MKKKILIIGGMGPQASIILHEKIIHRSTNDGVEGGADFPTIVHVSIPVPESLNNNREKHRAMRVLARHLYCLWQPGLYSRSYCL